MITINKADATELTEVIEDSVEYWVREMCNNGALVSGESAWKVVAAFAHAKIAEMNGECLSD